VFQTAQPQKLDASADRRNDANDPQRTFNDIAAAWILTSYAQRCSVTRCSGPRGAEVLHAMALQLRNWVAFWEIGMLRQLAIDDMDSAAVVLRMSFDEALPTLAGLHTPDEDRWFFRERLFATCQLWGYFDGKELLGFIAFREGWIDQLYVLPLSQRRGIGTALLQVAQSKSGHLSLWTFLRNKNARRFYEKHGFVLVQETDGTRNEEKEPDAMYSWRLNGALNTEALP
jgi:putative acetyltransferase